MATSLLSTHGSEVRQPGRISQPSAHNCIYEKAELRAASLSPKSHAAHRQGEELMGSSRSSLEHKPTQPRARNKSCEVCGRARTTADAGMKKGWSQRVAQPERNRCTFPCKGEVTELETSLEDDVQWGQQALGCSSQGKVLAHGRCLPEPDAAAAALNSTHGSSSSQGHWLFPAPALAAVAAIINGNTPASSVSYPFMPISWQWSVKETMSGSMYKSTDIPFAPLPLCPPAFKDQMFHSLSWERNHSARSVTPHSFLLIGREVLCLL